MDCSVSNIITVLKKRLPAFDPPVFRKKFRDPFQILIFAVLSTRTRDEITIPIAESLFSRFPSAEALAEANVDEIASIIRGVAFWKQKARWVKTIAQVFKKGLITDEKELMKLPGVGRKVMNVYLAFLGKPVIAVDTHVHRISNRLGWVHTKTPEETEKELMLIVPENYRREMNELFVALGQRICLPRNPKCEICPIKECCAYWKKKKKC